MRKGILFDMDAYLYSINYVQVKFSLDAAKSSLTNASIGNYDASAGMFILAFSFQ